MSDRERDIHGGLYRNHRGDAKNQLAALSPYLPRKKRKAGGGAVFLVFFAPQWDFFLH